MTKKYQRYDKTFKLKAARLVTEHGYSYVKAAGGGLVDSGLGEGLAQIGGLAVSG